VKVIEDGQLVLAYKELYCCVCKDKVGIHVMSSNLAGLSADVLLDLNSVQIQ